MAFENTDATYPSQWRRLTEGDDKNPGWGSPILPKTALHGKTAEELASWAANCKGKIAFYLGKIPDNQEENDGFWEVRCYWFQTRSLWLMSQRALLIASNSPLHQQPSAVRPMTLGGWPGAQPVSFTKKRTSIQTDTTDGTGEETLLPDSACQEATATETSPTALLASLLQEPIPHWPGLDLKEMCKPFKRPRLLLEGKEKEVDPSDPGPTQKEEDAPLRRSSRLKKKNSLYCDEDLEE